MKRACFFCKMLRNKILTLFTVGWEHNMEPSVGHKNADLTLELL